MHTSILTDIFLSKPVADIVYPDYSSNDLLSVFNNAYANISNSLAFIDTPIKYFPEIANEIMSKRNVTTPSMLIPYSECLGDKKVHLEFLQLLSSIGVNIAFTDVVGSVNTNILKLFKPRFVLLASTEPDLDHLINDRYILATCRFYKEFGINVAVNTFADYDNAMMAKAGFSYAVHHQAFS